MACPICGKNCNTFSPSPGAGVTITRLNAERSKDMTRDVTLSKERWYVTVDRTRAVKDGDPEAAFLLVGKDGAIAPEVAAHYGVETYTGQAVEKATEHPAEYKERMVAPGSPKEVAEGYEEMRINKEVRESVNSSLTIEGNRSATRQAEIMSQGIIHKLREEGGLVPAPAEASVGSSETQSRTKDIAPDAATPPADTPSADPTATHEPPPGGDTQTGQALIDALTKAGEELEAAVNAAAEKAKTSGGDAGATL